LAELKRMFWRQTQIRLELKSVDQGAVLEALSLPRVERARIDDLTYRLSFDREEHSSGEVIRQVVAAVDVRDIFIEEESIEGIVRRIYTGTAMPELQRK
jgi:ABC-type uncharacterized transport system ATPase subunit